MDLMTVVPFLAVLLGIVLRTVVPYLVAVLEGMKQTGEWPVFNKKYLVSSLAALFLDIVVFVVVLLTSPGRFTEIATLDFVFAVLIGYGGTDALRSAQKAGQALFNDSSWQR